MMPFFKKISENRISKLFLKGKTKTALYETFILQIGVVGFGLLTNIAIARLFGKNAFGIYSYFFSLVALLVVFSSFGIPNYISKLISQGKISGRDIKKSQYLMLSIYVIVCPIGLYLSSRLGLTPSIKYFSLFVFLYVFFKILFRFGTAMLRGVKRFVRSQIFEFLNRGIFFAMIFIAFYLKDLKWIFIFNIFVVAFLIVPLFKQSKRHCFFQKLKPLSYAAILLPALAFFFQYISLISLYHVDRISINFLLGFSELGQYNAYSSITSIIRLSAGIFPLVMIPMAATIKYKIKKSFLKVSSLLLPFSLMVIPIAYFGVPLLYGNEFPHNFTLTVLLVISSALLVIYSFFNSVYLGESKFSRRQLKVLSIDASISLIINFWLNLYFINLFGIIGAPLATILVLFFKIILNLYGISKERKTTSLYPTNNIKTFQ